MNDSVEVPMVYKRVQKFCLVAVKQGNPEAVNVDFREPATHFTIACFAEPLSQQFVVSVVVAENSNELAV
jgi:hypothetical protein